MPFDLLPDLFAFEFVREVGDRLDQVVHLIHYDGIKLVQLQPVVVVQEDLRRPYYNVGCDALQCCQSFLQGFLGYLRQHLDHRGKFWTLGLDLRFDYDLDPLRKLKGEVLVWDYDQCGYRRICRFFVRFVFGPPYSEVTE